MSRTSTLLASVAALGVAAGVVLVVARPRKAERPRVVPELRVRLSVERAIASAGWRF